MRIRRTSKELVTFHRTVADYMAQGYPQYKAEERAWDHLHTDRRLVKQGITYPAITVRRKVTA